MRTHYITRIADIFRKVTAPYSCDPDSAFMEYMTKSVLVFLTLLSAVFLIIALAGWSVRLIPADTMIIILIMGLLFLAGWVLAHKGRWKEGSIIPPAILFASAVYGNIIGGIDAPAMIIYVLAILLVAVLRGIRDMYWALAFSLLAYLSTGIAHRYGYLTAVRSARTFFINRVTITLAVMTGIALLIRFLIIQFRTALLQARTEISERKAAEDALRDSEKKYRELVQNSNSIILRINMRGEITFWNEFAEIFFGYKSSEILGKNVINTIVPETDQKGKDMRVLIRNLLKSPEDLLSNENENMTKTGKRVWIAWANRPIRNREGEVTEILCIGNDITERRLAQDEKERIQTQLIHAQKMEAIGTLTSGLAHDFNNILGGIMGSLSLLDLLLKEEPGSRADKAGDYIKIAIESSQRASEMIHQLLLLSRKQDIKLSPVDINDALAHV
ncbi:MAG: PAS domain S-box protein, partial [Spirochaetota bacterium]